MDAAFGKFGGYPQRTRAAEALRGFGAAGGDDFVRAAEQEFLRGGIVGGHAVYGQVVFAGFLGKQAGFGGFDGAHNRGLSGCIFIDADAEIDFLRAGFGFEGFAETQNGVGGGGGDGLEQHGSAFVAGGKAGII